MVAVVDAELVRLAVLEDLELVRDFLLPLAQRIPLLLVVAVLVLLQLLQMEVMAVIVLLAALLLQAVAAVVLLTLVRVLEVLEAQVVLVVAVLVEIWDWVLAVLEQVVKEAQAVLAQHLPHTAVAAVAALVLSAQMELAQQEEMVVRELPF